MHIKDEAAPKDAEDEHSDWRNDLAGSVVSLIMATILSMHKSTCPSGTRLENALDTLLQVYSRDASGFLASVLNFQNASGDESTSEEHEDRSCSSCTSGFESQLETQQTNTGSFNLHKKMTEQQMKLHSLFFNNDALKLKQERNGICFDVGPTVEKLVNQQINAEDEKSSNLTELCFDKTVNHKEIEGIPLNSGGRPINEQTNLASTHLNDQFISNDAQFEIVQTIYTSITCDKESLNPSIQAKEETVAESSNHQVELSVSHVGQELNQPKVILESNTATDPINSNYLNGEWTTQQAVDQEAPDLHTVMKLDDIVDVCSNKESLNLPIEEDSGSTNQQTISIGSDFDTESINQQTEMDVTNFETEPIDQEIDMVSLQLDTQLTNQEVDTNVEQDVFDGSDCDRKSFNQQTEIEVKDFGIKSTNQQTEVMDLSVNQKLDVTAESISQHTSVTGLDLNTLSVNQQTDVTCSQFSIQSVDQQSNTDTESISQQTAIISVDFNQQTEAELVNLKTESVNQQKDIKYSFFNQQSVTQQTDTGVEYVNQQTTSIGLEFDKEACNKETEIDTVDLKTTSVSQQTDIATESLNQQAIVIQSDSKKKTVDQQTEINLHCVNQQTELMGSYFNKKSVSQEVEVNFDIGKTSTNQETEITSSYFNKESINQQTDNNVGSAIQQTDLTGSYFDKESISNETEGDMELTKRSINQQTDITAAMFWKQSIGQQTDNNMESINQQTDLPGFFFNKKWINQQVEVVEVYLVKKSRSQQTDLTSSCFENESVNNHTAIDVAPASKSINQQTDMTSSYFTKESINQQTDNNAASVNQQTDILSSYFSKELTDNQTEVDANLGKRSVKQQADITTSYFNKKSSNQQTDNNAPSVNQQTDIPSSYFSKELTDNQTEVDANLGKRSVKQQADITTSYFNKKSSNQQTDNNAASVNQQTDIPSSYFSKELTDNQTEVDANLGKRSVKQQADITTSYFNKKSSNQQTDNVAASVNQQTDDVNPHERDTSFLPQAELVSTDTEPSSQQMDSAETAVQCSLLCDNKLSQSNISSNQIVCFMDPNLPPKRSISVTETNINTTRVSQATQVYVWLREKGINTRSTNTGRHLGIFKKSTQLSDLSEYSESKSDFELDSFMETVKNVNSQITSACENLSALNCNSMNSMRSYQNCSTSEDTEEPSETESVDQTGVNIPENDQKQLLAFFHATLLKAIENQPELAYFVPSSASYTRMEQEQCVEDEESRNNEESEETVSESGKVFVKPDNGPNPDNNTIIVTRQDLIPFDERGSILSVIDEQPTLPSSRNSQETIKEQPSFTAFSSTSVLGNVTENEAVAVSSDTVAKHELGDIKNSDENKKLNSADTTLRSESLLRCSTSRKLNENISKLENKERNNNTNQQGLTLCNTEVIPSFSTCSSASINETRTRSREQLAISSSRSNQVKDQLQPKCRNKEHEFAFSPSSSEVDTNRDPYGLLSLGGRDNDRPTTPIRRSRSIGCHELSRMEGSRCLYRKSQMTTPTCRSPCSRRDDFLKVKHRENEFYTASDNINSSSVNDFLESTCKNRRSRLASLICNSQGDKNNNVLGQPHCRKEEPVFSNQEIERLLENTATANTMLQRQLPSNSCLKTVEEPCEEPCSKCTSEELRSSTSISRGCLKKISDCAVQFKECRRRSSTSLHKDCKMYEQEERPHTPTHSKPCEESRNISERSRSRHKHKNVDSSSKSAKLQNNNSCQHLKELVEAHKSTIRCNQSSTKDISPLRENNELLKSRTKCRNQECKHTYDSHRARRAKTNDLSEPIISVKMVANKAKEEKKTWSSCNNFFNNDMQLLNKIERANREWQTVFPLRGSKSSKREVDNLKSDKPDKKINKRSPTRDKTREQFDAQLRNSLPKSVKNQLQTTVTFHEKDKPKRKTKKRSSTSKSRGKQSDPQPSTSLNHYSGARSGSPFKLTHSKSSLSLSTVPSGSTITEIVRDTMSSESIQSDGIEWEDYARTHNIVSPRLSHVYRDRGGQPQVSVQANNHSKEESPISFNRRDSSNNAIRYRRECSPIIATARDMDSKRYTYTLLSQENAGLSTYIKKQQRSDSTSRSPSSFHRKYSGLSIATSATTAAQTDGLFESTSDASERDLSDKTSVLLWSSERWSRATAKESQDFKCHTFPLQSNSPVSAFAKKGSDSKGKKKKKVSFQSGDTSPARATQIRVWTQQLSKTEEAIRGLRARIEGLSSIMHF